MERGRFKIVVFFRKWAVGGTNTGMGRGTKG